MNAKEIVTLLGNDQKYKYYQYGCYKFTIKNEQIPYCFCDCFLFVFENDKIIAIGAGEYSPKKTVFLTQTEKGKLYVVEYIDNYNRYKLFLNNDQNKIICIGEFFIDSLDFDKENIKIKIKNNKLKVIVKEDYGTNYYKTHVNFYYSDIFN